MLVDKDGEIAALGALLGDCARGKGSVAVIRGPVATGKTTLLHAMAEQAVAAGAIVLGAVASRAERGLPLGVLDQLFRGRPLPAAIAPRVAELMENRGLIGTAPEPEQETVSLVLARVFDAMLTLLAELSEGQPVVIAVDDLQYADVASLQCLSYLARRAASSPILMVLAEGTHMLPADQLLHAEILRQGNCRCIPLAPLPPSGVARLLAAHVDAATAQRLAPACHALTGGNPLLVNALGEDAGLVPRGAFRSAVVTCLHRYEPELVELAEAVAILGENATLSLLGELMAISPESVAYGIDALEASGLLESGRFRHAQARQAVLGQMTADERAATHGRAARALYRTGAASATLAAHVVAAYRIGTRWAVAALQEAAEQALAEGEARRAIDYLRRAESECADDRQRAAIRFSLACAEWPIDPECAARHLSALVADAHAGLLASKCLGELAYYLMWVGDTNHAAEILATIDIGPASPPPGQAEFPAHQLTIRSPLDFLYPDLATRARRVVQEAKGLDLKGPAAKGPAQAAARLRPQRTAAGTDSEAVLIVAERILSERSLDDRTLASITTALMALICEDLLDQATSWCDILLRESAASRGNPFPHALLTAFLAIIETRRGNLSAAENHARAALALLTKKAWGVAIGAPLSSLLLAATASRKHEDAAACLRMTVPDAMFGTFYGLLYLYARGEYYLATGRPHAALADFTDCGDRMIRWELDLPGLVPWRIKAAEAHLVMGNSPEARELSREQLAQAGPRLSRTRGISLRALALTSHPAKRTALLRESAEVLRDAGAQLELAYTFSELSNAHLALGEHSRAHWAARQARNLAERCGAQTLQTALSKVDTGRPEAGGVDTKLIGQLSDAEQRVAKLAAYGYTNGQIAHKLYITVSTVEQHLTRVYRKLGVAGRAELPVEVTEPSRRLDIRQPVIAD
jgi:DNA-binding CsgD family transcriptional regulator